MISSATTNFLKSCIVSMKSLSRDKNISYRYEFSYGVYLFLEHFNILNISQKQENYETISVLCDIKTFYTINILCLHPKEKFKKNIIPMLI